MITKKHTTGPSSLDAEDNLIGRNVISEEMKKWKTHLEAKNENKLLRSQWIENMSDLHNL